MFCNKCGNKVNDGEKFCNRCGNQLILDNTPNLNVQPTVNNVVNNQVNVVQEQAPMPNNYMMPNNNNASIDNANAKNIKMAFIGVAIGLVIVGIIFGGFLLFKGNSNQYYFDDSNVDNTNTNIENNGNSVTNTSSNTAKKGRTIIITDNTYDGVSISTADQAKELIINDSVSQKDNCPKEILQYENELINKYQVTAVNLCEMDLDMAKGIVGVFEKLYSEFPSMNKYLTNFSLYNSGISESGVLAYFQPVFPFAESNDGNTIVIKTRLHLNTATFLNPKKAQKTIDSNVKAKHFPPNSTVYSTVAHEMGHYISFLTLLKKYNSDTLLLLTNDNYALFQKIIEDFNYGYNSLDIIETAYNNYIRDTNAKIEINDWRATISAYAVYKDADGNYIYDETIAESFNDVYSNGDKASIAARYVYAEVKRRMES